MTGWHRLSEKILESYFDQTEAYIAELLTSREDCMEGLLAYYQEAWKVPKRYKGNSAALGFVPEYLIFVIVKQYLENKYDFDFIRKDRRQIQGGITETAYFIDGIEPRRLLVQGLRIRANEYGFPPTDCQHDVSYMVWDGAWKVKAIIEVKGHFESASLKGDIEKLENAEKNYPKADDPVFAFIGFIRSSELSSPAKEEICPFVARDSHFFISPGGLDPKVGNTRIEDLLERL